MTTDVLSENTQVHSSSVDVSKIVRSFGISNYDRTIVTDEYDVDYVDLE